MASQASKIDSAAEKAYAEAAAKKTAAGPGAAKAAAAVEAPAAKTPAKKKAPKKAAVKKAATKKPAARKAAAKPAAKKPAASKAAGKTKAPTKKPAKAAAKIAAKQTQPTNPVFDLKDKLMATAKTEDLTKTAKEFAATAQARIKDAYDKGTEMAGEATEFTKGNVEAVVESGKIIAAGVQDMSREALDSSKGAVETVTADVKKIAAVKSPTEMFQLQSEIARRNFDAAIALGSKNTEALVKLANDAFAPISSRMSVAAEKISKAA